MAVIITYNVNGIRSAVSKGLISWLRSSNPDVLCLQEIKATPAQIPTSLFEELGYYCYWFSAEKKGYSGVGLLTKQRPDHVTLGSGIDQSDYEGRVIRADFDGSSVMSVYVPSGSSGETRQAYKMVWLEEFADYIATLKVQYPNLIISGDYNICHQAIDIHDPVRNKNSSGFLPEERQWMGQFIDAGFVDSFRHLNKNPHHYSWWSFRSNARANNKGWRIDYNLASQPLAERIKEVRILPDVVHSDHCPVLADVMLPGATLT